MSEKINYKKIAQDISKGYDVVFINEFPEIKQTILEIKNKPECGGCLIKNIPLLFSQPEFENKIKLIYGDDTQFDLSLPSVTTPENKKMSTPNGINIVVKEFSEQEWRTRIESVERRVRIHSIATYYKPETQTVVATLVYSGNLL